MPELADDLTHYMEATGRLSRRAKVSEGALSDIAGAKPDRSNSAAWLLVGRARKACDELEIAYRRTDRYA